jgi:C1A family cysteine protease
MIKELFKMILRVLPDPKDKRDYLFVEHPNNLIRLEDMPRRASTGMFDSLARDQGVRGTCVAFATAASGQMALNREFQRRDSMLSVECINDWCEERDNHPPEGTYLRLGAKYLHKVGCFPEEKDWPYGSPKPEGWGEKNLFEENTNIIKAKSYYRASTIDQICKAIYAGHPVMATVQTFLQSFTPDTNVFIAPPPGKNFPLGYHAIKISSYDIDAQRFQFLNSWGMNWGDCGYGYISFEYFERYKGDVWVIDI